MAHQVLESPIGDGKLSGDTGNARVEPEQLEASLPLQEDYDVETVERVYRFVPGASLVESIVC